MSAISRRDLFSGGIAAGAMAALPRQLLSLSAPEADSPHRPDVSSPSDEAKHAINPPYSASEQAAILKLALDTMIQLFSGKTLVDLQSAGDRLRIPAAATVNVTLRHRGRVRGSVAADGASLGRQVVASLYAAALDRSYGSPLTKGEVPEVLFEVWIQTGASEVSLVDRSANGAFLAGVEGLEIEYGGQSAHCLPSVAITSSQKTELALLGALCLKAGLEEHAWQMSGGNRPQDAVALSAECQ